MIFDYNHAKITVDRPVKTVFKMIEITGEKQKGKATYTDFIVEDKNGHRLKALLNIFPDSFGMVGVIFCVQYPTYNEFWVGNYKYHTEQP